MPRARPRARTRRHHLDRRAHRDARRGQLLEAAVEVIRREGPGASMEQIASAAGVSKPILYRHFGDRDGLVRALSSSFVDRLMADLRAALRREADARELLVATVDAYLAVVEEDPQLYRFLVQRGAGPDRHVAELVQQVGQEVALVIGEQLRAVGLDSGAAEPWAFGLVGMVHAAGDWWVERRTMPRRRLVEYLTSLVWDGLAATQTQTQDAPR